MAWGTVTIGGLAFRETVTAQESSGKLTIVGQESTPPQDPADVHAAHLNVLGLVGSVLPVTFSDKTELTGFYQVTDATSDMVNNRPFGTSLAATWQLGMARLGTARDLEFESRLPTASRFTDLTGPPAAVFWHAPPSGFADYYTGTTVPSGTVTRQSAEGPVAVFTGVPAGVYPRWTCDEDSYMAGSAQVLIDGIRRAGTDTPGFGTWEVSNGLVQVVGGAAGPSFAVACWSGTAWLSAKTYTPTVNGVALVTAPTVTIMRNDPEQVLLRLSYPASPGRLTVDLLLRRGARTVAGTIKRQAAATLGVTRTAAETATAVTGGLRATAADSDGNRFVMGSSRTATTVTATAAISKASVLSFDFFLGHEVGASPQSGDAFADLLGQHLGTGGEQVRAVRR
jgi:hypothetical protein